jgi:hypothetical protein
MCGQVVCGLVVCGGRGGGGREEEGGSAQPKTRTPHKDVGKMFCGLSWNLDSIVELSGF